MSSHRTDVRPPLDCVVDWPQGPPKPGQVYAVRTADDGHDEFQVTYHQRHDDGNLRAHTEWLPRDRVTIIENQ